MPKVTLSILVGVPGSGKSTFAGTWEGNVVSLDSVRLELTGNVEDQSKNAEVLDVACARVSDLLLSGKSVLLDATNVEASRRARLLKIAKVASADTVAYRSTTPHSISQARNTSRSRVVPEAAMDRMISLFDASSVEQLALEGWKVLHY